METLTLMLDTAAVMVVIFYSLRNERQPPGSSEEGPFRIKPAGAPPAAPMPERATAADKRRRTARL